MLYENTPTIHTERLILRKFTKNDLQSFMQIMSDEEVNTFLPWFPVKTLEEAKEILIRDYLSHYDKASAYRYAICLQEDGLPVGYACLSQGDSHDFGYGLKKEFWNKGFVTEACKAVFDKIKAAGFNFITATHDAKNIASGKVMEKLGMTYRYSYVEQWQPKDIGGVCCRGDFAPEHSLHVTILPKTRRLPPGQSPGQNHAGLVCFFRFALALKHGFLMLKHDSPALKYDSLTLT